MQIFRLGVLCALACRADAIALQLQQPGSRSGNPTYYWPHARGHVGHYSMTPHTAPANLTATLSWSWHHPEGRYRTVVVSAPLIDDQKNIYISSQDGIRKFSQDGNVLWYYVPRGPVASCPSLMGGSLFGSTQTGWVFALDMATGRELWIHRKADVAPGDTGYVEAHDGVVVLGVGSFPMGGATRAIGLDANDGRTLWEYESSNWLWNMMAVFPGDDSFIVMDTSGGVVKHALHNATVLWKRPAPAAAALSFSDGGVMVGPDGTSYTCSNLQIGSQGSQGALRAYRLQDGELLWERSLDRPCNSWPVITPDGRSVIVPAGAFVDHPASSDKALMQRFGLPPSGMHDLSLKLGSSELKTYGREDVTAAIQAFDARTGEPQWSTELPPYGRMAARGDEEGYLLRHKLHMRDQCLPAQFGSPTISGDGTVYVGRADGLLYGVESGTGRYRTFDAEAGFLHPGTSWAPGMMAVASCDGLFVWNY